MNDSTEINNIVDNNNSNEFAINMDSSNTKHISAKKYIAEDNTIKFTQSQFYLIQFPARVYPAASASLSELNQSLFSSLIFEALAHQE